MCDEFAVSPAVADRFPCTGVGVNDGERSWLRVFHTNHSFSPLPPAAGVVYAR